MNPWMLLVVMVLLTVIAIAFRAQRPRRSDFEIEDTIEPRMAQSMVQRQQPLPSPQRRRLKPPPLPPGRVVEYLEALPVAKLDVPSAAPAPPPVATTPSVTKKPRSTGASQLAAFLKDRKTFRSAIALREVLSPPLCKRRRRF